MTRLVSHRTRVLLALALLTVAPLPFMSACADHAVAPTTPPDTLNPPDGTKGGKILGVVEVTLSGIGSGSIHASARPVALAPAHPATLGAPSSDVQLALTPLTASGGDGSVQLEPVAAGSFTDGARGSGGERYLYATFKVRNAQDDGTPYTDVRNNLTFLGVSTTGDVTTIDQTAIASMQRFDSSAANSVIATQIMPTGHVVRDGEGRIEADGADVVQFLTESDVAAITPPTGVTSIFPYGFVVHNPTRATSRTLPSNPSADQFDGVVTFAFKVPLQATPADDPFTISAMFLAVDDDQTRVTQSLEEQTHDDAAALEARADALGADSLTLLPGGAAFLGNETERIVCAIRTAGDAGSPTATLDLPSASAPWLIPSPWGPDAQRLPRTAQLAVARCPSIASADASSLVVHGFQSGGVSGTYTGVGTSLVHAPAASFFPGEEVEVTLTTDLGGTTPTVGRYRVAATGGSGIFDSLGTAATGTAPQAVAVGDWDGDGDLDLATVGLNDLVVLMRNNGAGQFTTAASGIAVGNGPVAIVAADVDGDGDLDLATADKASDQVSIIVNGGSANFTHAGSVLVGTQPDALALADLDGDGDIDLAVANAGSDNVSILQNDGSGNFTVVGTPSAGDLPADVAAADFDGDGDIDLAVADQNVATVTLLQNDGTGTFTNIGSAAIGSHATSIAAADLDGDGDVDLAVINANDFSLSILRNDGTGRFTGQTIDLGNAGPIVVTAMDVDGDGDLDLGVLVSPGDGVWILRNDGAGRFTYTDTFYFSGDPIAVAGGDLDNDGEIDLAVVIPGSNTISLLRNR